MSIYKTPFRSLMCLCIILGLIGLFRQAEAQGVTVTSISPVVGKVGDEVTIVGTNFSTTASENLVDFSGVMGTVTSATATELKVTVPAGALVGPISVTVGGLTAHSPQFFLPSFTGEGGGIATESFGDKFELRVGDADKVSIGDLDGDGKPDLVITVDQNYGVGKDDSVSVLLNQSSVGNFSFASPMLFGVENDPTSVAIGDLDGDGKPDLAVGNRNRETGFSHLQGPTEDNVVSVLLNQSSGGTLNFADRVEYQVGAGPSSVAIGDLDGDGKHDIAAAEDGTNSVSVLRNQSTEGTLAFAEKATFAVGEDPFPQFWALSVSMGDLDGNGKPDLAVANSRLNRVSVLQNQSSAGSLAFAEHVDLTVGASPSYVSIGDLDGDGKPDLGVTYGNYNWQRTVSLLRNLSNAAGLAFEERVDFEAGWRISSMTIGDLDDDGRPDLAVADDYRVSVFRNLQGLTVSSVSPAIAKVGDEVTIEGAKFSTTPAENLVDFGGVMGTVTSATSSELIVEVPMGARFGPISVTVGGRTASSSQFFLPTFAGPGGISTDTFGPAVNFAFGGTPQSVSVGDLDGDGKPDMAVAIQDSNTVAVLRNTSSSGALSQESFDRIGDFAVDTGPNSVSIGDLDGDGKLDLVTTNTGTDIFSLNNTVSVLRNTSGPDDLTFGDKVDFTVGSGPNSVSIGDLDGDGKPDLVVTNLNFFQGTTVSVLRNTSGPDDLTFESKVDFTVGLAPAAVSIGDLDGDGRLDLTVVNLGDNTVSLLRNTTRAGPITFESKVDFTVGSGPGAVSIGDLDGDGKLDLAVVNLSDNTVSLLRNTTSAGTVAFDPKFDLDVGSGPTAVSIGDLDGDGLPDLVVANQEANTVSVLRQTGSGTLAFHPKVDLTAGADPAHVLIGDLDGNDIPDLVVANLESKTVSVVRNLLMSTPGVTTDPETDVNVTVATLNARVRAFGQETTVTFEYGEDTSYGQTVAAEPGTVTGTDETEVTAALSELLPGTEYHYRVMATNGTGTTVGDDRTFNTQERATTGQTADVGTMDATLSASVRGDGEEKTVSFEVGTDTNYGQSVAADPPTVSGTEETTVTASFTGLEPGTQYHVRVKVEGSSGVTYGEDMTFTTEGVSFALSIFPMVAKVGEEVTIAGGDFSTTSPENLVDFSGVEGRVTSATATELVVTVPTGSRFGPISVTVGGLTVTSSAFFLPTFEGGGEITIDDFDTTVDLAVGLRPRSSDLADLDGDGKLDLVIRSDRTVSVLHNTSTTGSLTFDPRADVGEGRSSAIGDLNGDGKPDLVVASSPRRDPDSFVSIFRNGSSTGTITFDTKVSLTSSDELSILEAVSIGDLDGDGRPDLVVVDRRAGVVSVLRNTSSADVLDFQLKVDFGVGEAALDVSIGDLDADGKPDLVVANLRDDTVSLLRNASGVGAITFEPKVDLTVGNGPVSVSIGDLDGDGKLDLAVANLFANTLSVLRNTSSVGSLTKESFDPKVDLTAVSPIFVSIGDLDGDGKPDLAVASQTTNAASVLRNKSSEGVLTQESFGPAVDLPTGAGAVSASIGDLDGDGRPDLAVANQVAETVSLLRNQFQAKTSAPMATTGEPTEVGITGATLNATVQAGGAKTTVTFEYGETTDYGQTVEAEPAVTAVLSDLKSGTEYHYRVVATNSTGTAQGEDMTFTTEADGGGGITSDLFGNRVDFASGVPVSIAIGDVDGDGKLDVAVANRTSAALRVFLNQSSTGSGTTSLAEGVDFTISGSFATLESVAMGDLDGDGKPDLVVADGNPEAPKVSVFRNNSSPGSVALDPSLDFTFTGIDADEGIQIPQGLAIGDLDGDGKLDLAVSHNPDDVSVFRNTGSPGELAFEAKVDFTLGDASSHLRLGDLDGDGKLDLVAEDLRDDVVSVLRNTSTSGALSFEAKADFSVGDAPTAVEIGDLDGDGKPDLVAASFNDDKVSVLHNTSSAGNLSFAPKVELGFGTFPFDLAILDADGDGKPDLAVVDAEQAVLSVVINTSTEGTLTAASFGTRADIEVASTNIRIAAGDLNGDDRPDVVVGSESNQTISVLHNQSAPAASPPSATTRGATDVTAASATLNGTVQAGGAETTVTFEYGETTDYGEIVNAEPATVTGTEETAVTALLSDLTPGTVYHYRVVAENSAGTTQGEDKTFALVADVWTAANSGLPENTKVNALAIDPSRPETVYAGTSGGGVFKTADGGGFLGGGRLRAAGQSNRQRPCDRPIESGLCRYGGRRVQEHGWGDLLGGVQLRAADQYKFQHPCDRLFDS